MRRRNPIGGNTSHGFSTRNFHVTGIIIANGINMTTKKITASNFKPRYVFGSSILISTIFLRRT
jgi:hypothetical protein